MKSSRILLIGAALAVGGFAVWHFTRPAPQVAAAPPPVPVQVAAATQGDVPIYLTAIGNVTSLNSVEIRPQVGGTLVDVPVKEGDAVKKGQLLAVIDPRPFKAALDRAQAQLVQDQAQLQNAELDYKRYSALAKSDFASRQQVDTQVATVNRLQGVVAADAASIEEAQINLSYTVLKAPLDGLVGLRRVDPGNLVQANSTGPGIFLVVQYQPISVIFNLPETELPTVRDAMKPGKLSVLADSADGQRVLGKGELVVLDNAVDSASGTIPLRADFPNPDLMLAPGQFVNVRLQIGTASGVMVAHNAIQHGQDGLFVFSVKPDDTIERTMVTVAYDNGQKTVLSKGLEAGAKVVVAGQARIGTGTKVAYKQDGQPATADNGQPPGQQEQQSAQR